MSAQIIIPHIDLMRHLLGECYRLSLDLKPDTP